MSPGVCNGGSLFGSSTSFTNSINQNGSGSKLDSKSSCCQPRTLRLFWKEAKIVDCNDQQNQMIDFKISCKTNVAAENGGILATTSGNFWRRIKPVDVDTCHLASLFEAKQAGGGGAAGGGAAGGGGGGRGEREK